ncbi:MAG: hypothetical protein LCH36_10295 [Actinobacteria bacterium]|nr:hypothetical protein [Actinomycetota bacterium]
MEQLTRADWLVERLAQVPPLVVQLRSQAVPSLQAKQDGRVSGSRDVAAPPLQLTPLDEADALWARVCSLAVMLATRLDATPPAALDRQRLNRLDGVVRVQGFASSHAGVVWRDAFEVTQWLIRRSWRLAMGAEYGESVDKLAAEVDRLAKQVGAFTGYRHKTYRPDPCWVCGQYALLPRWGDGELLGIDCEHCGASREVKRG